jgi:hypothetical protein
MKKILINGFVLLLLILTSCASNNYYDFSQINDDNRYKNNQIRIISNVPDFKVYYKVKNLPSSQYKNTPALPWNTPRITVDVTKLDRRVKSLIVQKENYEPDTIKIKRAIRPRALGKDIVFGVLFWPILPVPFLIDLCRPDFYKVSKNSKVVRVDLKFNQEYMDKEFFKIENSKLAATFSSYINLYPYSKKTHEAALKRDSIELEIAVNKFSEQAINDFVSTHNKSKYLDIAIKIKDEMVVARLEYDKAKTKNNADAYEEFIKKYPNAIQKNDAINNLVDIVYQKVLKSEDLEEMLSFNFNYLVNYSTLLKPESLAEKTKQTTKIIDELIVKKYDVDVNNRYANYSKLWMKYREATKYKNLIRLERTESYLSKISDLILNDLAKIIDEAKQKAYLIKAETDFKDLFLFDEYIVEPIQFSNRVIDNSKNFNGSFKLINQKYIENRIKYSWEGDFSRGLLEFDYLGQRYSNYNEANIEEIAITNGRISSVKLYNNKTLLISYKYNGNSNVEYSSYINGKLVRTDYSDKSTYYYYEFENGINLSLKSLEEKIKGADYELASKNYDNAIELYNNCYKNDYPKTIELNQRIQKSINTAQIKKEAYLKKLELERIANERKEELARLETEKANKKLEILIGRVYTKKASSTNIASLTFTTLNSGVSEGDATIMGRNYHTSIPINYKLKGKTLTITYPESNQEEVYTIDESKKQLVSTHLKGYVNGKFGTIIWDMNNDSESDDLFAVRPSVFGRQSTASRNASNNSSTNSTSYNRNQSVKDFVEGKYFRNNQTGLRVKYGYISSLNTYGITFVNSYENKFYYMNCSERLSSDEQYMELTNCMSPDDGSGIGDIDVYKDRIVINARDGSLTYYIE